ncbi:MAG: hypothetical protein AUJ71_04725 [Candidatus Omnitrophica bacterium CG1_02_49_16]|nr:MAG: hypothetical protein AUJ71_04725 [Candidatus Omnitrophica bacterium CG1_02_49_16]
MKKIALFVFGVVILTGFAGVALAEDVQGPVQSIDTAKNAIVVQGKTIIVHPKVLATLKNGTVVTVALKPGSNTADTVAVKIG